MVCSDNDLKFELATAQIGEAGKQFIPTRLVSTRRTLVTNPTFCGFPISSCIVPEQCGAEDVQIIHTYKINMVLGLI